MKIRILLPLLAVVLAGVGVLAFKPGEKKAVTPTYWIYNQLAVPYDPYQQTNYAPTAEDPSTFCTGSTKICIILAEEDNLNLGYPKILGEPVQELIELALEEGTSLPEDGIFLRN